MDIQGYVQLSKEIEGTSTIGLENFAGKICRVMEFSKNSDNTINRALIVSPNAEGIMDIDNKYILNYFECSTYGDVICPPNMTDCDKIFYSTRVHTRKGGYPPILRNMVITASLMRNKFNDNFLWTKQ